MDKNFINVDDLVRQGGARALRRMAEHAGAAG